MKDKDFFDNFRKKLNTAQEIYPIIEKLLSHSKETYDFAVLEGIFDDRFEKLPPKTINV